MKTIKPRLSEGFMLLLVPVFLALIFGSCEYILPNKPPYLEKVIPADSAVYTVGQVVSFKVNAYDVDGFVKHVVFTPPNSPAYTDDAAPYEFAWQTTGLTAGYYKVEIKAIDDEDEPYIISAPIRILGGLTAYAGKDTTFTDSRTGYVLEAEVPILSQGTWTIISGTGGQLSDIHDPKAILTGLACETYTLRWTVSNGTNQVADEVTIRFFFQPSLANAGADQVVTGIGTSTVLQAVAPSFGTGHWRIASGNSGYLINAGLPNSAFTGLPCTTYSLIWSVSTPCAISSDTVEIRFDQLLVDPDAGPDQIYTDGRISTSLAANSPGAGTGIWSVIAGQNGQFTSVNDPRAVFSGQLCQSYILRWTLSTPCSSKSDDVTITFNQDPSTANAGPDQAFDDGRSVVFLDAVPPAIGTGEWRIVSGGTGYFSVASLPNAVFTGLPCHTYTLSWTVSTLCSQSDDTVEISFGQSAVIADAGPDMRISDGSLYTFLQGNNPGSGVTGKWSVVSGQGGVFEDPNNPVSRFTGMAGQVYTLKWLLSNACVENSDLVNIAFISSIDWIDARDGKTYRTVTIGNQVWMAENLSYSTTGSYLYDSNSANATKYGRLYDWNAASSACPTGWHLPSDAQWRQLEGVLGMKESTSLLEWFRGYNEGGMLKEEGIANWEFPNAGATNVTGFTARPGGYRTPGGVYGGLNSFAGFWTATVNTGGKAICRALDKDKIQIGRDYYDKGYGFSVRCIKN